MTVAQTDLNGFDDPYRLELLPAKKKVDATGPWRWTERTLDERQARNTALPYWLRISHYCYANMKNDRHCQVASQELEKFFSTTSRQIRESRASAIEKGYLDMASNARCLVAARGIGYKESPVGGSKCKCH